MKKIYTLSILFFIAQFLFAQQDSSEWKITFDLEGGGIHLTPITGNKDYRMDREIYRIRRISNPIRVPPNAITDNPHFHFATFGGAKFNTSYKDKYQIQTNLYIEDRGASYGINDRNNLVWFPEMFFAFQDTLRVFNQEFAFDLKMGNLFQHQVDNGLKFYNLDVQALDYKISYKNFFYRYNQIGDLSYGVGLDLEELYHYAIGYENEQFKISVSRSWNSMLSRNGVDSYQEWGLSGNYFFNKNNEVYFQVGTRYFGKYNIKENSAFLLGAKLRLIHNLSGSRTGNKITWSIHPKIRYYSANYNFGHYNPFVIYRKPSSILYSNTVGRYLYPLRNYYNDFDQWAVFTEYQNEDVLGLGLKTNFDYMIFPKIKIATQLETMSIRRQGEFYTNYFYDFNIFYTPVKGFQFGVMFTNKAMNLDVHYQTFYMMREPMIGAHLKLTSLGGITIFRRNRN